MNQDHIWDFKTLLNKYEDQMKKAIDAVEYRFDSLHVGVAKPEFLYSINVELFGARTPINQITSITAKSSSELMVQVWDKNNVQAVNKALSISNLGINIRIDGRVIYVIMPHITESRRKELIKIMHKYTEDAKITIRGVRKHFMDEIKKAQKDKLCSENDEKRNKVEVEKLTKKYVDLVSDMCNKKDEVIMKI